MVPVLQHQQTVVAWQRLSLPFPHDHRPEDPLAALFAVVRVVPERPSLFARLQGQTPTRCQCMHDFESGTGGYTFPERWSNRNEMSRYVVPVGTSPPRVLSGSGSNLYTMSRYVVPVSTSPRVRSGLWSNHNEMSRYVVPVGTSPRVLSGSGSNRSELCLQYNFTVSV